MILVSLTKSQSGLWKVGLDEEGELYRKGLLVFF